MKERSSHFCILFSLLEGREIGARNACGIQIKVNLVSPRNRIEEFNALSEYKVVYLSMVSARVGHVVAILNVWTRCVMETGTVGQRPVARLFRHLLHHLIPTVSVVSCQLSLMAVEYLVQNESLIPLLLQ